MARKPVNAKTVEAEIALLPDLGLSELRARWKTLFGLPAPKFFRRKLLVRAVAYPLRFAAATASYLEFFIGVLHTVAPVCSISEDRRYRNSRAEKSPCRQA